MTKIEQLNDWDKNHVWHAFTQMQDYEPLVIDSADGIWLTDIHGRKFIDGVSSLWCNVHGHRKPELDQAIVDQVQRVSHVTLLGSSNSTTVELARKLVDITPAGLNHVFFGSDGASAVEAALKMAFQYWRQKPEPEDRSRFMALEFAYHGDTIGSVSLGGVAEFHQLFRPLLFDVIRLPSPGSFHSDQSPRDMTKSFLNTIRPIFEKHGHETAALIVEPLMQGAAGMIAHPASLLRALRELCDEFDVLLIADEVAVGFGRTGKLFACEHENVSPDIMCLGKGLTGGYLPLSATLANTKIYNAFLGDASEMKTLFHGHTFGGNPVAAAVALANIKLFETPGFFRNLQPLIDRLNDQLESIEQHEAVKSTRSIGLMAGIELHDQSIGIGNRICYRARDKSVLLRALSNVIVVMPPLVTPLDSMDAIFAAIRYALDSELSSDA